MQGYVSPPFDARVTGTLADSAEQQACLLPLLQVCYPLTAFFSMVPYALRLPFPYPPRRICHFDGLLAENSASRKIMRPNTKASFELKRGARSLEERRREKTKERRGKKTIEGWFRNVV